MGNYARKARKQPKVKGPRCCGRHMVMNKYGLWQCKKCGRQKFDTGSVPVDPTPTPEEIIEEAEVNTERE